MWAGLAAASVPIIIHLLTRLRRRPQIWGAMRFLLEAYRRHRSRLRLEQLLLLALRCLILAVLGVALCGPLLTGCADDLAGATGWQGGGRFVCIVLDDSLTTHADDADGTRRFDRFRDAALEVIDALAPGDHLSVWRAARPEGPVRPLGTLDHLEVRRRIEDLRPRFSVSDLEVALESVNETLDERSVSSDRAIVVLLSDWAGDAMDLDRPLTAAQAALAKRARLFAARPAAATDNVQVLSAVPRRYMVLSDSDGSAHVPVEVGLRRFVGSAAAGRTLVRLNALGADDKPLAETFEGSHDWLPGQFEAVVQAELRLDADKVEGLDANRSLMTIEVEIGSERRLDTDAIEADDHRWTMVEVRSTLRVGVVDRPDGGPIVEGGAYTPGGFISFVLSPGRPEWGASAVRSRIEQVILEPAAVTARSVEGLDAALVLRPDLLDDRGWQGLQKLAHEGGMVWLFMPVRETPAVWAEAFDRHLGLDWQVAIESENAVEGGDGTAAVPWTLALDAPVPEPLSLLAVDWQALLRPVRITRRHGLSVPAGSQQVWLSTADGRPVLASAPVGAGRMMLMAVAVEEQWSNLPKKPLFIPLIHESLRSTVGTAADTVRLSAAICGHALALGPPWQGVGSLESDTARVSLRSAGEGAITVDPISKPGIYRARPASGRRLVVNVDPEAGNTTALDAVALEQRFQSVGSWQWLDSSDPARALAEKLEGIALGWPLLWAVLALVLLETFCARWFSHARGGDGVSWRARLSGWVKG